MVRTGQTMKENLGINGVQKYAYQKGGYYHFRLSMGARAESMRELHMLQVKSQRNFPIVTNNERFGGLPLRDNKDQGRRVEVLAAPFDRSLESYLATRFPPAAAFYDLGSKEASAEELNRVIQILKKVQTLGMALLICGGKDYWPKVEEYRFSDYWLSTSLQGLQRKLSGLRMDWDHKLSIFDQNMNGAWAMDLLLYERDRYTAVHSVFVAMLAYLIGEKMGMTPLELEFLKMGGIWHDVGKIGILDRVLRKPDSLSEKEFRHMRQHPLKGLRATTLFTQGLAEFNGWAQSLQDAQREHHLRYDGKGYPKTKKQPEEVSLFSRIISMADALDAMTTMRSYLKRNPYLTEKIEDIKYNKEKQFDPRVADACLNLLEEGISLRTKMLVPSISMR